VNRGMTEMIEPDRRGSAGKEKRFSTFERQRARKDRETSILRDADLHSPSRGDLDTQKLGVI